MKTNSSLFFKIAFVALIALLMLIPLAMVKNQIRERQNNADSCRMEVSQSWGNAQTLAGPALVLSYDKTEKMPTARASSSISNAPCIPKPSNMKSEPQPGNSTAPSTT